MKQHNNSKEGNSVTIEISENGYILTYSQHYIQHKKVFNGFDCLVSFLAQIFGLKDVGACIKVIEINTDELA